MVSDSLILFLVLELLPALRHLCIKNLSDLQLSFFQVNRTSYTEITTCIQKVVNAEEARHLCCLLSLSHK